MLLQLLTWTTLWGWRIRFDNQHTAIQDLATTVCFGLWETRILLWELIQYYHLNSKLWLSITILIGGFVALSPLLLIVSDHQKCGHAKSKSSNVENTIVGKPLFFPSRTSHIRFFPKKHSFTYSYLFVGIPIGWRGCVNSMLSADTGLPGEATGKRGYFDVDARNYLARGSSAGLQEKLEAYLRDQGTEASEYPFAYLVTAPAFLGYSFNPVSFWYLYTSHQKLGAILVEVNNTNDERHMYLLKLESINERVKKEDLRVAAKISDEVKGDLVEQSQHPVNDSPPSFATPDKPLIFTNKWAKEFYVSPFNVQTGNYSIIAHDPLVQAGNRGPINTTLTLVSPGGRTLIVARVFSTGGAIDPALLNPLSGLAFIASWWWVGFATFPRIVVEAAKLSFKKKLQFFSKPEIKSASIGRRETSTELILELFFRGYLRFLVERSKMTLEVRYTAPVGGHTVRETFASTSDVPSLIHLRRLNFDVRTPLFFSRFVHYNRLEHALAQQALCTRHENRTLHVSSPGILKALVGSDSKQRLEGEKDLYPSSSLDRWRWSIVRCLRKPPAYAEDTAQMTPQFQTNDNASSSCPLDDYVLKYCDTSSIRSYQRTVFEQFLADWIALSDPGILNFYDLTLRVFFVWMAVQWRSVPYAYALNGPFTIRDVLQILMCNMSNFWALAKALL